MSATAFPSQTFASREMSDADRKAFLSAMHSPKARHARGELPEVTARTLFLLLTLSESKARFVWPDRRGPGQRFNPDDLAPLLLCGWVEKRVMAKRKGETGPNERLELTEAGEREVVAMAGMLRAAVHHKLRPLDVIETSNPNAPKAA